MNAQRAAAAGFAVLVLTLAGCGGEDEQAPAEPESTAEATTETTAPPVEEAPPAPYADPTAMVSPATAGAAGLVCDEEAETSAYGDLSLSCDLKGEQVYLSTFDSPEVGASLEEAPEGFVVHVDNGWAVQAEQQDTLDALVGALSS